MLTPKDTPTRETRVLDGTWRFAVDWDNDLDLATLTSEGLPGGLEIAVPASVNDLFADEEVRNHVGYWWYQRRVRVPRGWGEDQVLVHFGSATHAATVWVAATRPAPSRAATCPSSSTSPTTSPPARSSC